ncbi:L,D-transpeptidase family protein [Halobacillus sp. Nhm2S1]|uniref:L,D-transpeptidase family protein n=1 Tax=Halobacillus sp. Nhm2S1 TaxID=2866716 RepID=UPI001C72C7FE|nr:L,D-transpeptidase family protein [Halobacillus sp. Nhm2S1]MBX0358571.1 L,D-transpeptidase family protein [Halobacillus sp. Nhm2S1]
MLLKKLVFVLGIVLLSSFLMTRPAEAAEKEAIIINKSNNQLAFYENGKLQKVFPVATGRTRNMTPEGKFTLVNKVKNRPWYKEGIPGGDPRNPLGARWLGIKVPGDWGHTSGNVYGVHGTNQPSSIGTYASSGCIRMYNEDVIWLFDRADKNIPVYITSSSASFTALAQNYGVGSTKAVAGYEFFNETLRYGSKGDSVAILQRKLNITDDGMFGPQTLRAVKKFQASKGLVTDGIVGPKTRKALFNK